MRSGAAPVGALELRSSANRPLVFATYLAPNLLPVYQSITAAVAKRLGIPVRLEVGRSFNQLLNGDIDVAFVCGLPYVRLAEQLDPLAAPVVASDRYRGRPIYFSDVIVRRDSPFQTFADLRGASWSLNDPDSHSGYLATLARLLELGETDAFFGRVVDAGWHQVSIELVASGLVDASAVDSHVLAVELRDRPDLASRLRVVDSFGPWPIQPVVARRSLDTGFRERLRDILAGLAGDGLRQGLVERLTPITDDWYDPIRAMLARVTEAGLTLSPTDPAASRALAPADR